jgi:hypothetical protein
VIRVLVEVRGGTTRFRATVWAEGIAQALNLVDASYPDSETTVLFPIEPEAFFAMGSAIAPGIVLAETLEEKAG